MTGDCLGGVVWEGVRVEVQSEGSDTLTLNITS